MNRLQRAVAKANQRLNLKMAAALLAGSALLSSMLGLYRDRLLNSTYFDTYPVGLDAYTVAFIIPDFMFFILVSGALSVTFIPVFNDRLTKGNKKSAWELSSSMINLLAIVTLAASLLIIIFADPLVRYAVGPGLDEQGHGLAVSMMRVIAINPFLFAIASVIASMQQAVGRFVFFALAPTIYNIGIIFGILVLTGGVEVFGIQFFEGGIMGVALGVVLGSILQLVVGSFGLSGMNFGYQFRIFWRNKGFRQVLRLLPPRSVDQGFDYFNSIVETNLASRLVAGSVRAYQQATTLHMVPVTLIGVAISTAAFPQMTERLSQGRKDLFRSELQSVLRVIIWLALPTAAIAFFTRGYLVNFLFNGGEPIVAGLLGILTIAILFRSIYHIAARSFYARQDTRTPLYISFFTIGLNILLAILFVVYFNWGIYGLAWAQSIVAVLEVGILFYVMSAHIPRLFDRRFMRAIWKMCVATSVMSFATYSTLTFVPLGALDDSFYITFPKFAIVVMISGFVYLGVSRALGLGEPRPVLALISRWLGVFRNASHR